MNSNWPHADAIEQRSSRDRRLFCWAFDQLREAKRTTLTLRDLHGITDTIEAEIVAVAYPDSDSGRRQRRPLIEFRSVGTVEMSIACHTVDAALWLLGDLWPYSYDPVQPPQTMAFQNVTPTETVDHGAYLETHPSPYEKPFTYIDLW